MTAIDLAPSGGAVASPVLLVSRNTLDTPLIIQSVLGQTADLLEFKNSVGTVQARIDPTGMYFVGGATLGISNLTDTAQTGAYIQLTTTHMNLRTRATGNSFKAIPTAGQTAFVFDGRDATDASTTWRISADGGAQFNGLVITDANVQLGTATGTQFGTATNQKLAFYGSTPVVKPTVSGSKGANAALTSLMTALAALGLCIDTTT